MGSVTNNSPGQTSWTSNTDDFDDFSILPSHPFYVHPSDNPDTQLVYVLFNGSGFVTWRKSMLISLSAKNKLGLINGRVSQRAPDSPYYPFWERCNDMIIAWITNSLSRDIATSVLGFNTAKQIWIDINKRFGESNGSKCIHIQKEINSLARILDIASYFTKLRSLWDELHTAYVGPVCSCGALPKFLEDQKLFQFLSGLNDIYFTAKSTILMMSPYPKVSKAYSMLQHDEKQKEGSSAASNLSTDSMSFVVSTHNTTNNRHFNQRVSFDPKKSALGVSCKYCKKLGHTLEKCYKLHGYPSDFKFTRGKRSASCVQTEGSKTEDSKPECCMLSSHIVAAVGTLLCCLSQFKSDPWILDSGETNHITPYKHLLSDISPLPFPKLITLPNGYKAKVVSSGFFFLNSDITLPDILIGPSLKRPLAIDRTVNGLYILHSEAHTSPTPSPALLISSLIPLVNSSQSCTDISCYNSNGKTKLQPRATTCVFLGYPLGKKGYKLLNLLSYSILYSRDAIFHETVFPYHSSSLLPLPPIFSSPPCSPFIEFPPSASSQPSPSLSTPVPIPPPSISATPLPLSPTPSHVSYSSTPLPASPPDPSLRKSLKTFNPPSYLQDYICSHVAPSSKVTYAGISIQEPQFYHQAISNPA
ncbi:uncharacterized protein LOC142179940 [Nicotiana tabacum]|uniref:Uncharacterized protein LOC142179940 n=1 Tax=Nicotiana tabacum TaxID=4097 RepID=A0AC58UBU3_TOBAC